MQEGDELCKGIKERRNRGTPEIGENRGTRGEGRTKDKREEEKRR